MSALLLAPPTRALRVPARYGRRVNLHVVADEPEPSGTSDGAAAAAPENDRTAEPADLADLLRRVARGDSDAFARSSSISCSR